MGEEGGKLGDVRFALTIEWTRDSRREEAVDQEFVKRAADVVKLEREQQRIKDNVRLLDAELIKSKAPAFWKTFLEELRRYADAFNAEFDDRERHVELEISNHHVTIRNSAFPRWKAICFFNLGGQQLEITHEDGLALAGASRGSIIHLDIGVDRSLGFLNHSTDEVIKLIVGRVFQGAAGKA